MRKKVLRITENMFYGRLVPGESSVLVKRGSLGHYLLTFSVSLVSVAVFATRMDGVIRLGNFYATIYYLINMRIFRNTSRLFECK
jgi:hypothetical protein